VASLAARPGPWKRSRDETRTSRSDGGIAGDGGTSFGRFLFGGPITFTTAPDDFPVSFGVRGGHGVDPQ
jgi:hypothetical protein